MIGTGICSTYVCYSNTTVATERWIRNDDLIHVTRCHLLRHSRRFRLKPVPFIWRQLRDVSLLHFPRYPWDRQMRFACRQRCNVVLKQESTAKQPSKDRNLYQKQLPRAAPTKVPMVGQTKYVMEVNPVQKVSSGWSSPQAKYSGTQGSPLLQSGWPSSRFTIPIRSASS